jgi:hypothetical protein
MSRYRFELATEADDEQLRRVLAAAPMDGDVSVSFQREPSYFDAAVVGGDFVQTVVGRLSATGEIVGFGVRSVRTMFVNGQPRPIGYLSTLRLLPEHRNLGLIARGYRFFAELHDDRSTSLYLTTIAEGNDRAVDVLTRGRAGLPPYHKAGRFFTFVIPPRQRRSNGTTVADVIVRSAVMDDLPAIVEFLNEYGRRRQFFPCYDAADFFQPRCTFRDLQTGDILLAVRDRRIVGTLGMWDQSGFRQSVVHRYSRRLQWTRPAFNLWARLRGMPRLPPVGETFPAVNAAIPVVADDDPAVYAELFNAAARWLAESSRHLLLGLHETDPLLPVAAKHAAAKYVTRLYYVCWSDGDALRRSLDNQPLYLELGTL